MREHKTNKVYFGCKFIQTFASTLVILVQHGILQNLNEMRTEEPSYHIHIGRRCLPALYVHRSYRESPYDSVDVVMVSRYNLNSSLSLVRRSTRLYPRT